MRAWLLGLGRRALLVVGWLWCLPTTLLGLLLVAPTGARPYRLRPAGVWWWVAERGPWAWFFRAAGKSATTIGAITISIDGVKDDTTTIRHERNHTIQDFALGFLSVPEYFVMSAMEWAAGRDPYEANPLEVDAYDEERKPDGFG